MSPVMSLVLFPMLIGSMSHVDFKKWPCHPVEFKVKGPKGYIVEMNRLAGVEAKGISW